MTSERIFVGSYTSQAGGGTGIGLGTVDGLGIVATIDDPSFLARSADGRFLYSVNEVEAGRVSAFAVNEDGTLIFLNDQSTNGQHPCHLEIDPTGRFVLSANYSSGSIAIHPIAADGSLGQATQYLQREGSGPNQERQEGPHAHQVTFDRGGEFVLDIDLGSDTVYTSRLSEKGQLEAVSLLEIHAGAGPRHVVFHPGGAAAYVINELDSTLTVCSYVGGELTAVQTVSTRPEGAVGRQLPGGGADLRGRPVRLRVEPRRQHHRGVRDRRRGTRGEADPDDRIRRGLAATPCLQQRWNPPVRRERELGHGRVVHRRPEQRRPHRNGDAADLAQADLRPACLTAR